MSTHLLRAPLVALLALIVSSSLVGCDAIASDSSSSPVSDASVGIIGPSSLKQGCAGTYSYDENVTWWSVTGDGTILSFPSSSSVVIQANNPGTSFTVSLRSVSGVQTSRVIAIAGDCDVVDPG